MIEKRILCQERVRRVPPTPATLKSVRACADSQTLGFDPFGVAVEKQKADRGFLPCPLELTKGARTGLGSQTTAHRGQTSESKPEEHHRESTIRDISRASALPCEGRTRLTKAKLPRAGSRIKKTTGQNSRTRQIQLDGRLKSLGEGRYIE